MTVITISRQMGSHGEEIAGEVARALGLRLVDAATIDQAASKAGVPSVALAELEHEGQRSLANQVLKALRTMPRLPSIPPPTPSPAQAGGGADAESSGMASPFAGIFSATAPPLSASIDSYLRMVDLVIRGLARQGNVLILGRGGQMVLRNHPGALHVQIAAPMADRVEAVMAEGGMSKRQAMNRVRSSDRARYDYLRRYHNVDWLDPTLYHLVINTGRLPIAAAVDLIVRAEQASQHPSV